MPPQKDIPFPRPEVTRFFGHHEPVLRATTLAQRKGEKLAVTTVNIEVPCFPRPLFPSVMRPPASFLGLTPLRGLLTFQSLIPHPRAWGLTSYPPGGLKEGQSCLSPPQEVPRFCLLWGHCVPREQLSE